MLSAGSAGRCGGGVTVHSLSLVVPHADNVALRLTHVLQSHVCRVHTHTCQPTFHGILVFAVHALTRQEAVRCNVYCSCIRSIHASHRAVPSLASAVIGRRDCSTALGARVCGCECPWTEHHWIGCMRPDSNDATQSCHCVLHVVACFPSLSRVRQ
jgi:hypothetical protein